MSRDIMDGSRPIAATPCRYCGRAGRVAACEECGAEDCPCRQPGGLCDGCFEDVDDLDYLDDGTTAETGDE